MTIELKDQVNTFLVSIDGKNFILVHSGYSHINVLKLACITTALTTFLILIQTDILKTFGYFNPPKKM
jgi:hypothetical protein